MVVNFLLTDLREVTKDDPLGRTWVGWNPTATDDELWEVNRGLWSLGPRVDGERFATLSFEGRVQVVAEITGRTRYDVGGKAKWALSGVVLRPGDPVHDALKGRSPKQQRNPVSYFDNVAEESLSPADRARFVDRDPVTMVVTWNPDKWNPDDWATQVYPDDVWQTKSGGLLRGQWSTGNRRGGIEPGDRIFLLRQGVEPRGVIGSGTAASRIFSDGQWDGERADEDANYVLIDWDVLRLPEHVLPHTMLVAEIPEGGTWRPQAGGWVLPVDTAARLETLWARHLGRSVPSSIQGARRQGWQLDPARRKKVEDAAQDRLMDHYRHQGWTVRDVRHGNPYDAVATRDGRTLWLEAKGTETAGKAVIVSRGEVGWARDHPGDCVMGILSDIVFLPDGEIDPASGTFRVVHWDPDGGDLLPRLYDFTPPEPDRLD